MLLPRMRAVFGSVDWVATGATLYHLRVPWVMPATLVERIFLEAYRGAALPERVDGDHRALGSKRLHDRRRPCARPQSSAVLPLPDQATLRGGLCSLPSRSSPPNVDQSKDKGPPAPRMRGTAVGQRARTVVDITDPARAPDVTLARIPKRGFALTRKITGSNPVSPTSITPSRGRVFGSRCSFTAR